MLKLTPIQQDKVSKAPQWVRYMLECDLITDDVKRQGLNAYLELIKKDVHYTRFDPSQPLLADSFIWENVDPGIDFWFDISLAINYSKKYQE